MPTTVPVLLASETQKVQRLDFHYGQNNAISVYKRHSNILSCNHAKLNHTLLFFIADSVIVGYAGYFDAFRTS